MTTGLGIDTGGTYTDAVVVDMASGKVLAEAKSLTTRDDLSVGIDGAIAKIMEKGDWDISLVALSSTLATNSIVEGKGCRAGLVCIGREYDRTVDADCSATVGGAHDLDGKETAPFDEDALRKALGSMRGRIDALAVTGYLSVRNPEHEVRAAAIAREVLGVPVVCGHQLSMGLGFNERTTTAIMNAKLIPVITDLIGSVEASLEKFGIGAPLMIVKGDGSIISRDAAMERPVETVLSGPASSLTGALALTGIRDGVMIDVGGTTTDIGILRGGSPRLEEEGAMIGGKRTRVKAVAVSTFGIGGDSRIIVNGDKVYLTPVRAIPVCIAASRWPRIREKLAEISGTKPSRMAQSVSPEDMSQECEFFVAARPRTTETLQSCDAEFLRIVRGNPLTADEAAAEIGVNRCFLSISKLERLGLLTRIGVTPTDILHAEGTYTEYDAEASRLAVGYQARKAGMPLGEYIRRVKGMIEDKIATCLMRDLVLEDCGCEDLGYVGSDLVEKAVTGACGKDFSVSVRLNKPVIGIGAPVEAWLPAVAEKFGTELVLPDMWEVGNAIGAITGSVSETETILIRPLPGQTGADPECTVFTRGGNRTFGTYGESLSFAEEEGARIARAGAERAGAAEVVTTSSVDRRTYRNAAEGSGEILLEAVVTVKASGKPRLGQTRSAE